MFTFRVDVFAWIPQDDVWNPIYDLPGGEKRWGVGACGPRFGGDGFVKPPSTHAAWNTLTYRARQTLAFKIPRFGDRPDISIDTGVVPGLTTVLTDTRASGGNICTSLKPNVSKSYSKVDWCANDEWYEMSLQGEASDPIPAAALKNFSGTAGSKIGSILTPGLEWDLTIRIQQSEKIKSSLTSLRYAVADLMNLDVSEQLASPESFGGKLNLVHGLAYVRRFPSYVVYVTVSGDKRNLISIPVYFADGSKRRLEEIIIGQNDRIRQLPW